MTFIDPEEYTKRCADAIQKINTTHIRRVAALIREVSAKDGIVFTMGNGGSSSTASHFAADLNKAVNVQALCLTDATPAATAYMNDDGADQMFLNQLTKWHRPGDLIFAISCSGNSPNVVNAMPELGKSVLLTGDVEGAAKASLIMRAQDPDIRIQEDVHMAICHAIIAELGDE